MKYIIVDYRNGDQITESEQNEIDESGSMVFYIHVDGHVEIGCDPGSTLGPQPVASLITARHIDEISAERSRAAYANIEAKKEEVKPSHDPLEMATRVWSDEHSGSSGTAEIHGPSVVE